MSVVEFRRLSVRSRCQDCRKEVVQRLLQVRPDTLGHALRIPGVTPAAVAVLSAYVGRSSWSRSPGRKGRDREVESFSARLGQRLAKVGLSLRATDSDRFERYYRLLAKWNARINLTSLNLAELPCCNARSSVCRAAPCAEFVVHDAAHAGSISGRAVAHQPSPSKLSDRLPA